MELSERIKQNKCKLRGHRVFMARRMMGLSVPALSERLNLPPHQIKKIESGHTLISDGHYTKVKDVFDEWKNEQINFYKRELYLLNRLYL